MDIERFSVVLEELLQEERRAIVSELSRQHQRIVDLARCFHGEPEILQTFPPERKTADISLRQEVDMSDDTLSPARPRSAAEMSLPNTVPDVLHDSDGVEVTEALGHVKLQKAPSCMSSTTKEPQAAVLSELPRQHQHSVDLGIGFHGEKEIIQKFPPEHTAADKSLRQEDNTSDGTVSLATPRSAADSKGVDVQQEPQGKPQLTRSGTSYSSLSVPSFLSQPTESVKMRRRDSLAFLSGGKSSAGTRLHRLVTSNSFEIFFAWLIALNGIVIAAESQYDGIGLGFRIGYPRYDISKLDVWPGAEIAFPVLKTFFGSVFTIELIFKVVGLRTEFVKSVWCLFDAAIVVLWLMEVCLAGSLPTNATFLRICRLARLLRLLRLVRNIQGFDALFVLTTALQGCMSVLFWTFLLLLTWNMTCAVCLNHFLMGMMVDEGLALDKRHLIFEYFGSSSRALLTVYELTLGNWVPVARMLMENVSEYWVVFCISHKVLMLAVVGIINGVFMQETFATAQRDDNIMMRQKMAERRRQKQKMDSLFAAADIADDGMVQKKEFVKLCQDPEVQLWLAAQEIDASDPIRLFLLLDVDGNGLLDSEEFVSGIMKLKGVAKQLDVLSAREDLNILQMEVLDLLGGKSSALSRTWAHSNVKALSPKSSTSPLKVRFQQSQVSTKSSTSLREDS